MRKNKHKKKHGYWNNTGAKNVPHVQYEEKREKDHESNLVETISKMETLIATTGLTEEDLKIFNSRLEAAKVKLANLQQARIEEKENAKAYQRLVSDVEKRVSEFESLVNNESLPQEKEIDIRNEENLNDTPILNKQKMTHTYSESNKWTGKFVMALFLLLVFGSYGFSYAKKGDANNQFALKDKTEKYIKDNLVKPGTDLEITDFAKEGDLYKFTISVGGQDVVSYLTGDGKKLLLNPVDLDQQTGSPAASSASAATAPVAEVSQKNDKPEVELFVMSYCPYGVQAEKGILPVIQKLGSKINFSVKFVDYTLHGKKEFDENLNQYCVQKEEPAKFNDYLACFSKEGDSAKCLASAKIDGTKNAACISDTDKQFKLTDNFSTSAQSSPFDIHKDLNTKYGVKGSPSLVVNGQLLDAGRDSASLLKTICSGFLNQPEECKATLSSDTPTPGFGDGKSATTGASAAAPSCH